MIQYKVTIHCGNTNAVHVMEGETSKEIYDTMQEWIKDALEADQLVILPLALVNPKLITFVTVEEIKAPEVAPSDTIEV